MFRLVVAAFLLSLAHHAESAWPIRASDTTYVAKPIAAQVPGSTTSGPSLHVHSALFFNEHLEQGSLELPDVNGTNIALYCALAGMEGPMVWRHDRDVLGFRPVVQLTNSSLLTQAPSDECPVLINNIASLKMAADQRLIYIQYEDRGEIIRGQLWPKTLSQSQEAFVVISMASASAAQDTEGLDAMPGSPRDRVRIKFNEWDDDLNRVLYLLGTRNVSHWYQIDLMCGPPGIDGEFIATLDRKLGYLRNSDIQWTSGSGACGVAINNTASLLEAYLKGYLYVRMIKGEVPWQLDDYPDYLRGQFPQP